MLVEIRGGVPDTTLAVAGTSATGWRPANCPTKWLQINNDSENTVKVYWRQVDADNDVKYITLGPAADGKNFFEGPVELADNQDQVWLVADADDSQVTIVAYQRRG